MASFSLWLLVAATLGWCGVTVRVSFWLALRRAQGATTKAEKLKLAVAAPFLMLPFVLLSALLPWASTRTALIFTYGWVTPCKLLLLASANFLLDCPSWSLSHFSHFLLAFLLPVRVKGRVKGGPAEGFAHGSLHGLLFGLCALMCFFSCYDSMAPAVSHAVNWLILYLVLDLPHRIASMVLLLLCGVETLPMFCKPWLATSLTSFWGKRWDLMANALLRHTVYNPIVNRLSMENAVDVVDTQLLRLADVVDPQLLRLAAAAEPKFSCRAKIYLQPLAMQSKHSSQLHAGPSSLVSAPSQQMPPPLSVRLIGVNVTFAISGLIHELLYFTLTQAAAPTWEVTAFFIVHGVVTSAEITMRRACPKHAIFKMPRSLKIALTMSFMKSTQEYRAVKKMMGLNKAHTFLL